MSPWSQGSGVDLRRPNYIPRGQVLQHEFRFLAYSYFFPLRHLTFCTSFLLATRIIKPCKIFVFVLSHCCEKTLWQKQLKGENTFFLTHSVRIQLCTTTQSGWQTLVMLYMESGAVKQLNVLCMESGAVKQLVVTCPQSGAESNALMHAGLLYSASHFTLLPSRRWVHYPCSWIFYYHHPKPHWMPFPSLKIEQDNSLYIIQKNLSFCCKHKIELKIIESNCLTVNDWK